MGEARNIELFHELLKHVKTVCEFSFQTFQLQIVSTFPHKSWATHCMASERFATATATCLTADNGCYIVKINMFPLAVGPPDSPAIRVPFFNVMGQAQYDAQKLHSAWAQTF